MINIITVWHGPSWKHPKKSHSLLQRRNNSCSDTWWSCFSYWCLPTVPMPVTISKVTFSFKLDKIPLTHAKLRCGKFSVLATNAKKRSMHWKVALENSGILKIFATWWWVVTFSTVNLSLIRSMTSRFTLSFNMKCSGLKRWIILLRSFLVAPVKMFRLVVTVSFGFKPNCLMFTLLCFV